MHSCFLSVVRSMHKLSQMLFRNELARCARARNRILFSVKHFFVSYFSVVFPFLLHLSFALNLRLLCPNTFFICINWLFCCENKFYWTGLSRFNLHRHTAARAYTGFWYRSAVDWICRCVVWTEHSRWFSSRLVSSNQEKNLLDTNKAN